MPKETPQQRIERVRASLNQKTVDNKQETPQQRIARVRADVQGTPTNKQIPVQAQKTTLGKAAGVADTLFGGGKVGEAIGSKLAPLFTPKEDRQYVDTSTPSLKEIGGSAARSALLFTPVGRGAAALGTGARALGVGAKLASGLGKVGAGAATGYGFDVASGLEQGEDVADAVKPGIGALVGGGLPVAGGVAKGATKFAGTFGKNLAAGLSGKGTKVIDAILDNPQEALKGLRGQASLPQSATKIRESVSNLAREASKEFGDDLANLPKRLGRTPKVIQEGAKTTIKVDGKTYTLSTQGVKSKLTQVLRNFDVIVDPKKGKLNFSQAAIDSGEGKRLQEVFDVVKGWKDTTPEGLHKLAKKISNYRKPGEQSKQLNAIIDSVSRNTRNYIGDRIPAAKEMLSKYAQAQDKIKALNQEFATKGSLVGGMAERMKTERKIANLFSGEKDSTIGLLEEAVPGGRNILAQEAGRELGGITRASASLGDLLRSAIQTVISPKLIGEITAYTGMTTQQVQRLANVLRTIDEPTRAATIQVLSEIFRGDADDANRR